MATVSVAALACDLPVATAGDCTGTTGAPPADVATPAQLYDTLRAGTNAELLAIGLLPKQVADECAWIYEVKVLTASGSVVELDFNASDLDLIGARGPENDRDAATLVHGFAGGADLSITGAMDGRGMKSGKSNSAASSGKSGSNEGGGQGGSSSSGGSGGSSGGSGGSGGDDGGSEGGDSGSDGGEGGDSGGEGGDSGEGGDGGDD